MLAQNQIPNTVQQQIEALGLDYMDMGQLCLAGRMADEFTSGGRCYDDFRQLKAEGLVRQLVVEIFPWTSKVPLEVGLGEGGNWDEAH